MTINLNNPHYEDADGSKIFIAAAFYEWPGGVNCSVSTTNPGGDITATFRLELTPEERIEFDNLRRRIAGRVAAELRAGRWPALGDPPSYEDGIMAAQWAMTKGGYDPADIARLVNSVAGPRDD